MTKTTNYQLNQWDAADPIRREDFNADNAALDAAIAALSQQVTADKVVAGDFNMDGTEEYGTVLAEYEPGFRFAVVWCSISTPAVVMYRGVSRLYIESWSSYRDIISGESAFTLGAANCTRKSWFHYLLFY